MRAHKALSVSDVPSFCATPCGRHFLKKKVRLGDIAFKIHLFPKYRDPIYSFVIYCDFVVI